MVQHLKLQNPGGYIHLCAEHLYNCLWETYLAEGTSTAPQAVAVVESVRDHSVNVAAWGDPKGTRAEDHNPSP